ncbi:Periplasmic beta-glucosidase [Mariniradius saccharolyticus AK6]|uniref:Periplasmic beta-glucosidase n=1 Tax=Mariniradius saccharolyticus AK6 TaxID=1239962 RepID=M7XSP9_9BACT|nr:glucoamylase family protein [Mariniradius saccharolyticus]EMS31552.1 Periplasmic beta-glucosidase [Mariniradius saccharolyticus AK6]
MKYLSWVAVIAILFAFSCTQNKQQEDNTGVLDRISDDSLMTLVQYRTFQYFWEGAEPNSGLARERYHVDGNYPENDQNVVTSGGAGFGVMAILVGIERGFITREQGLERLEKIVTFLENAETFHGVWPHWWDGETGKVKPFSDKDDGADLVETSFMLQGLLTVRQYFREGSEREKALAERIDKLWRAVEFDWHTKGGEDVLYWHWSPNFGWAMNFPVTGYNECMIMYVLAAASPTHGVSPDAYHKGWNRGGAIKNDSSHQAFGHHLALRHNGAEQYGGPLFWAHYSYLALDPRGLKDKYADYWQHNTNHTLINRAWCVENPIGYKGYGPESWGLTASYSVKFYAGHAPGENSDLGVISPTAALSSFPYTPEYSMQAMRHWYENLGDKVFGKYGFYDAFSETDNWFPQRYLAIDQGPIVVMIENHRTGLLWDLFMSSPEIQDGLRKLGLESPHLK